MGISKRVLILLLINPILLMLEIGVGIRTYDNIQTINKRHKEEIKVRIFLRTNLVQLLEAETNQMAFLLTGNKTYLNNFSAALDSLKFSLTPKEFWSNHYYAEKIDAASHAQIAAMGAAVAGAYTDKDASKPMAWKEGVDWIDSVKFYNNAYYKVLNTQNEMAEAMQYTWVEGFGMIVAVLFVFNIFFVVLAIRSIRQELKKLHLLNHTLENQNQRLQDFSFKTFHNLREPLRSIAGFMQLLLKRSGHQLDDEAKEFIDYTIKATFQMEQEIKSLKPTHPIAPIIKT